MQCLQSYCTVGQPPTPHAFDLQEHGFCGLNFSCLSHQLGAQPLLQTGPDMQLIEIQSSVLKIDFDETHPELRLDL